MDSAYRIKRDVGWRGKSTNAVLMTPIVQHQLHMAALQHVGSPGCHGSGLGHLQAQHRGPSLQGNKEPYRDFQSHCQSRAGLNPNLRCLACPQ